MEGFFYAQNFKIKLTISKSITFYIIYSVGLTIGMGYEINYHMYTIVLLLTLIALCWIIYKSINWFEEI